MKNVALEGLRSLRALLYPPVCAVCDGNIGHDKYLCEECEAKAVRITAPFCSICSEPFFGAITAEFSCANCAHRTIHFDAAVAAYRSRSVVRRLVHDFKYRDQVHLRHIVGRWVGEAFDDPRLREQTFDLLVPVPLHPAKQRQRGFNQARLLADLVSAERNIPCRDALERIRFTNTQTAYDRSERMNNLRNAFRLRKKADVRGLRVLLIDDVLTTGATLSECARILKKAGAKSVSAATAARA